MPAGVWDDGQLGASAPIALIVDDDPDLRALMALTLGLDGFQVLEAANGGEAWVAIHDRRPDVVLVDVAMPLVDGFELLESLRGDAALAGVAVIVVTASLSPAVIARAASLGVTDVVGKPYAVGETGARARRAIAAAHRVA